MAHRNKDNVDTDKYSKAGMSKLLTHQEQNRDPDRVDSGFGDDGSLSLSIGDRSYTGSDSMGSKSRDQVCSDGGSTELEKKTAKMSLSDKLKSANSNESGFSEFDSGHFSAESLRPTEEFAKPSFLNCFVQSNDMRYLLAPFWRLLVCGNQDGDTNLHLAIINCQENVINAVIDVLPLKQFLDLKNCLSQTPLHLAVITRQPRIVQKLIDRGASVDIQDRNGQTCLHLACQRGDIKTIKAIYNPRPDKPKIQEKLQEILETRNYEGLTPLHIAVSNNNLDVVNELISLGANTNATNGKSGYTTLHLAVEQNNIVMVSCLLFQGRAVPDAPSHSDCTPLHLAAGLGSKEIVATLIAAGANQSVVNFEGDMPFAVASEDVQELDLWENNYESMESDISLFE